MSSALRLPPPFTLTTILWIDARAPSPGLRPPSPPLGGRASAASPFFSLSPLGERAGVRGKSPKNFRPSMPPSAPFFLPWNGCASTSDTAHHWNWYLSLSLIHI